MAEKILEAQEKDNKYRVARRVQQKESRPSFILSMGCQVRRRRLVQILAVKWDHQYSIVVNFVHAQMSLVVVRSLSCPLDGEGDANVVPAGAPGIGGSVCWAEALLRGMEKRLAMG